MQAKAQTLLLTFLLASPFCWPSPAAPQNTIVLGMYPYVSPQILQHRLEPFADFIERKLGKKAVMTTAHSYEEFLDKARQGHYDLVYSPSHFAASLAKNHHYTPLLRLDLSVETLIVSLRRGQISKPEDLRNSVIAVPNTQALVTKVALEQLGKLNIQPEDIHLYKKSTHDRALHALFIGQADAAIISTALLAGLPAETTKKIHIVATYSDLKGDVLMGKTTMPNQIVVAIINEFPHSAEAKALAARWKFKFKLVPITTEELEPLIRFAPQ